MRFKKVFFSFPITLLCASICQAVNPVVAEITSIARTVAESLTENKTSILAVTDFTDLEGNVNVLGRLLAEEISISLASYEKKITVIDRNQLRKMLAEKGISFTGIIDPGLAKQIRKISGAEAILTGSVYPAGNSIYVSVKIIDAEMARIFAGASSIIERNQTIDELVKLSFRIPQSNQQAQKISFVPQVKEAHDFIFILREPVMDGNTLTLNIDVKNNFDQARYMTVDTIRAIDDNGKIYYPSSFMLGGIKAYIGKSGKIQSLSAGRMSDNFDIWMEENRQIKAQIVFKNISSKAKSIGFVEMTVAPVQITDQHGTFMRQEYETVSLQFTNIPVTKEYGSKP
ncbi:MAG: FlgO family outer membrane protein [Candidatus Omnitrophica bacterium]|nr:FlgO family outer membrane protein [Candidatus Omnitrophota bacterium]